MEIWKFGMLEIESDAPGSRRWWVSAEKLPARADVWGGHSHGRDAEGEVTCLTIGFLLSGKLRVFPMTMLKIMLHIVGWQEK